MEKFTEGEASNSGGEKKLATTQEMCIELNKSRNGYIQKWNYKHKSD
jgi:hypothetical protein